MGLRSLACSSDTRSRQGKAEPLGATPPAGHGHTPARLSRAFVCAGVRPLCCAAGARPRPGPRPAGSGGEGGGGRQGRTCGGGGGVVVGGVGHHAWRAQLQPQRLALSSGPPLLLCRTCIVHSACSSSISLSRRICSSMPGKGKSGGGVAVGGWDVEHLGRAWGGAAGWQEGGTASTCSGGWQSRQAGSAGPAPGRTSAVRPGWLMLSPPDSTAGAPRACPSRLLTHPALQRPAGLRPSQPECVCRAGQGRA